MNEAKIVVLAGAGISTNAGIKDFRSLQGLYQQLGEDLFSKKTLERAPQRIYNYIKEFLSKSYEPTKTHYILKWLQDQGKLRRIITQNVDCLEKQAGIDPSLLRNVHGSLEFFHCCDNECPERLHIDEYSRRARDSTTPIVCDECGALLRPDIVLFDEPLAKNIDALVKQDLRDCDLFICIGTSLIIGPVCNWPKAYLCNDAVRVWINREPPPPAYRDFFHIELLRDCDEAMSALFNV